MPSRPSDGSEAASEPRRTSLRRLSSLASLHALNPFARRRSNNSNPQHPHPHSRQHNTDHTDNSIATSSTSNLSASSHVTRPSHSLQTEPFPPCEEDELTALPLPPAPSCATSRRSSYICLPDDPIGGMPRSRTLSHLPLPIRTRRQPSIANSKSHSRLPSTIHPSSLLPGPTSTSTRIPTPPTSNRRYSNTRLTPSDPHPSFIRTRMRRSDTEPLLPVQVEQTNPGRHTAFKENITLSPVKPLPLTMLNNKDLYGSALPSRAYASRHGWQGDTDGTQPLLQHQHFGSAVPLSHTRQHSTATVTQSSPAYRSSRHRLSTPRIPSAQPVQRWNSQPVLTNITNRGSSKHGEVIERRLMTEVQPAPPPLPPKTPLSAEALETGKVKNLSKSTTHLPRGSVQSPSLAALATKSRPPSFNQSGHEVYKSEPVAYWCGRFSAIADRYRNEELLAHLGSPRASSDQMHTPDANTRRMRRALEYLHSLCMTQEARESFVVFQLQFAALQGCPELGKPLALSVPERKIVMSCRGDGAGGEGGLGGETGLISEKRERTFMDRLLGRARRSLV
ncbi:hypothetical protein D0863_13073 [Hortaea werneckii]|uniref:Uncharacterized protein n=1 Tax=Hortaea werneckii TaxID=91943 RepID=A0A3M7CVJ9_HORWE|nr:hypothetical protein D0863_13073 [Hortaea werneckii]